MGKKKTKTMPDILTSLLPGDEAHPKSVAGFDTPEGGKPGLPATGGFYPPRPASVGRVGCAICSRIETTP